MERGEAFCLSGGAYANDGTNRGGLSDVGAGAGGDWIPSFQTTFALMPERTSERIIDIGKNSCLSFMFDVKYDEMMLTAYQEPDDKLSS